MPSGRQSIDNFDLHNKIIYFLYIKNDLYLLTIFLLKYLY